MKKIISLILAFAVVFSIITVTKNVKAATSAPIATPTSLEIQLSGNLGSMNGLDGYFVDAIYDENAIQKIIDDNNLPESNFDIYFYPTGSTLTDNSQDKIFDINYGDLDFGTYIMNPSQWNYNTPYTMDVYYRINNDDNNAPYVKLDNYTATITLQNSLSADNFLDIQNNWSYDYVKWAIEQGLMNGISDQIFQPDGTLTRGMLVTILYRYEGEPIAANLTENFTDVTPPVYYYNAVAWCNANGIVSGYGDNTFKPDQNITREELATIIDRYCAYKNKSLVNNGGNLSNMFSDTKQISGWAYSAVDNLAANNIINGMGDGTFNPKGTATRAQVAKIMKTVADYLE